MCFKAKANQKKTPSEQNVLFESTNGALSGIAKYSSLNQ